MRFVGLRKGICERNSLMSRTFRPKAAARAAHAASPFSSEPYSFSVEPQVAQSVTMIVHVAPFENGDIVPGLVFHKIHAPIAARRHAAAFDFLRRDHRAPVAGEDAQRGGALVREEKALRAAEEKSDAIARFAVRLGDFREDAPQRALRNPREHRLEIAETRRQQAVQSQHIHEPANPEFFV